MPLQNRPPSPLDDSPSSPTQSPPFSHPPQTSPDNSPTRPLLRPSHSDPDSGIAIPFEQLTLHDREQSMKQQQQQYASQNHHYRATHPDSHAPAISAKQECWDNRRPQEGGSGYADSIPQWGASTQHGHVSSRPRPLHSPSAAAISRPALPRRNSSFSKRHASFDTPREVPLPYMTHSHHLSYSSTGNAARSHSQSYAQPSVMTDSDPTYVYDCPPPSGAGSDHAGSASSSSTDTLLSTSSPSSSTSAPPTGRVDTPMDTGAITGAGGSSYFVDMPTVASSSQLSLGAPSGQSTNSRNPPSPILPFSRPYSSPDAYGTRQYPARIHSPTPVRPTGMPDRSSTASLPLPLHTPYHTLPPFASASLTEDREMDPLPLQYSSSSSSSATSASASTPSPSMSMQSSFAVPARYRSPSVGSDWAHERSVSPPISRFLDRTFSSAAYSPYSLMPAPVAAPSPDTDSFPPPAPPVVLTPPPPPLSEETSMRAPHEPFLAPAPAPNDSYIAVETNLREYCLLVRLPGFRRDAILNAPTLFLPSSIAALDSDPLFISHNNASLPFAYLRVSGIGVDREDRPVGYPLSPH
ncbi:uncharacterized protein FIBRA_00670 [Fibroporia radiculosa]|uniref:Uncharacterized protein n=1 Tax=Fibroporia radiculosa TaxID=599839 RepID=J4G0J4_9APHY|nr:uncharacterized protein FIBRA_00670 [Fibroporia radiculosa]CCL98668.1 predicted protein [Fibroporia radiculosa]